MLEENEVNRSQSGDIKSKLFKRFVLVVFASFCINVPPHSSLQSVLRPSVVRPKLE